jgi:hypothetical protein
LGAREIEIRKHFHGQAALSILGRSHELGGPGKVGDAGQSTLVIDGARCAQEIAKTLQHRDRRECSGAGAASADDLRRISVGTYDQNGLRGGLVQW